MCRPCRVCICRFFWRVSLFTCVANSAHMCGVCACARLYRIVGCLNPDDHQHNIYHIYVMDCILFDVCECVSANARIPGRMPAMLRCTIAQPLSAKVCVCVCECDEGWRRRRRRRSHSYNTFPHANIELWLRDGARTRVSQWG